MSASDALHPKQFSVTHEGKHPFGGEWSSANIGGKSVGTMRYRTGADLNYVDPKKPVTHVEYIQVDEDHRGRGIAGALYSAVHEHTGVPFQHHPDEMAQEAKRAVAKHAAENPGVHHSVGWTRAGNRIARKMG